MIENLDNPLNSYYDCLIESIKCHNNEFVKYFQNLIKNCWSQSPENRPSFKEIAEQLKTDPNFITKDIVKNDFYKYIEFIDQSQSTFDSTRIQYILYIAKKHSNNKRTFGFYSYAFCIPS